MRCHYRSDLHLEAQDFPAKLGEGDVLVIAGDLCHALCLTPARRDPYALRRRYHIGETAVVTNCLGFIGRDPGARAFRADAHFDLDV